MNVKWEPIDNPSHRRKLLKTNKGFGMLPIVAGTSRNPILIGFYDWNDYNEVHKRFRREDVQLTIDYDNYVLHAQPVNGDMELERPIPIPFVANTPELETRYRAYIEAENETKPDGVETFPVNLVCNGRFLMTNLYQMVKKSKANSKQLDLLAVSADGLTVYFPIDKIRDLARLYKRHDGICHVSLHADIAGKWEKSGKYVHFPEFTLKIQLSDGRLRLTHNVKGTTNPATLTKRSNYNPYEDKKYGERTYVTGNVYNLRHLDDHEDHGLTFIPSRKLAQFADALESFVKIPQPEPVKIEPQPTQPEPVTTIARTPKKRRTAPKRRRKNRWGPVSQSAKGRWEIDLTWDDVLPVMG